jgi:hypothetical protein
MYVCVRRWVVSVRCGSAQPPHQRVKLRLEVADQLELVGQLLLGGGPLGDGAPVLERARKAAQGRQAGRGGAVRHKAATRGQRLSQPPHVFSCAATPS